MTDTTSHPKWVKPEIEIIELSFDKEMDAPCIYSNHTPTVGGTCGLLADEASNCWNRGGSYTPTQVKPLY